MISESKKRLEELNFCSVDNMDLILEMSKNDAVPAKLDQDSWFMFQTGKVERFDKAMLNKIRSRNQKLLEKS